MSSLHVSVPSIGYIHTSANLHAENNCAVCPKIKKPPLACRLLYWQKVEKNCENLSNIFSQRFLPTWIMSPYVKHFPWRYWKHDSTWRVKQKATKQCVIHHNHKLAHWCACWTIAPPYSLILNNRNNIIKGASAITIYMLSYICAVSFFFNNITLCTCLSCYNLHTHLHLQEWSTNINWQLYCTGLNNCPEKKNTLRHRDSVEMSACISHLCS